LKTRPPWFYKQSAVIPYRKGGASIEILLITSKRNRWIIPKGIVDPGRTPLDSACKEAYEEAGVKGRAGERAIGEYQYKKWGGICTVQVFPLEVAELLECWPEADVRQRKWMSKGEAVKAIEDPGLKQLIGSFSPYI
jgi:phosphohistidine phosphatase